MRRTSFKKPSYKDYIAKKASRKPQKPRTAKIKRKTKKDYYKELLAQNTWINKIPLGSHGSNVYEKKLWKLTSDYVRIEDFVTYGTCISCNRRFGTWQEMQAGHYRAYSKCVGYNKFNFLNVFGQCAYCNSCMNEDKFEGGRIFAENIVKRYGQGRLDHINTFTKGEPVKRELPQIIDMMRIIIKAMMSLPIKPDYYRHLGNDSLQNQNSLILYT